MKIPKDFDVVGKDPPNFDKGTNPFDNPQIQPSTGPVPETPGEKASNSTSPEMISKGQPFAESRKGGAGYTK